ncbi:dihydrodipicolinate synthase family protein [Microbacterium tumbae]
MLPHRAAQLPDLLGGDGVSLLGMVPTPFTEDGRLVDDRSLDRIAKALVRRGCSGLIALGVVAEPASLSVAEQIHIVEVLLEAASPSTPIVATLMSVGPDGGDAATAQLLREVGPQLSGVMVPVTTSDADGFRELLINVHERAGLPIIVQDFPASTGITITASVLAAAVEGLDFVASIRCQAPPTFYKMQQLRRLTPVPLMSGFGGVGLIDELLSGATAVACGITRPEVIAAALSAWNQGDVAGARRLTADVSPLINFETQASTSIGIRKEHWRAQGVIASAAVRSPAIAYQESFRPLSALHGFASS